MAFAMYLRKSRADRDAEMRGEGETLSRHYDILRSLAQKNHHAILESDVYREIVSGDSIAERSEVQRLLRDVSTGKYDGVYVTEVERLARGDTSDQGIIAKTFMISNTKIITPQKTYDPADEYDVEFFEFSLFMARREYKMINRRIQAGRMQSLNEGKYLASKAPYGYRRVKINGDRGYTLQIEPDEAQIVKMIFNMYLNGNGTYKIACKLIDMKIPAGAGKSWRPSRIHRMLSNEIYCGLVTWGRVKEVTRFNEDGRIEKSIAVQSDYKTYRGIHPPIIEKDLFDAVQTIRKERDIVPVHKGSDVKNPLAGLVFCAYCGHALIHYPEYEKQQAILKCRTYGCHNVQSYLKPIERAVLRTLSEWADIKEIHINGQNRSDGKVESILAALAALNKSKLENDKAMERLYLLAESGAYTPEMFSQRYAVYAGKQREINAAIAEQRDMLSKVHQYVGMDVLRPKIINLIDSYEFLTPKQKNELLKQIISKIVYKKEKKLSKYSSSDDESFVLDIYPAIKM